MKRLVHPTEFGLDLVQNATGGSAEGFDLEGQVKARRDKGRGRAQVAKDRPPRTPLGRIAAVLLPGQLELSAIVRGRCAAPLGGDARHAGAAEAVEHEIARTRVVQDRRDDREVRNFRMVAVRLVERVGLADARVHGEGLALVALLRVIGLAVDAHEVREEGVRARRVVRRIGQSEDVLIATLGEPRRLAKLGIA